MKRLGVILMVAVISLGGISGCIAPGLVANAEQNWVATLRTDAVTTGSNFEPSISILGAQRQLPNATISQYYVRSWVDRKTKLTSHQLYVSHYYDGEWIFWSSARDLSATALEFASIERKVESCSAYSGCTHTETFGADMADEQLRRNPNGYAVKFYSRTGREMVVMVDADQISKQLAAVDRARATLP